MTSGEWDRAWDDRRFDQASAADVLARWMLRPGGADAVFVAFRDVPGVSFELSTPGRRFRKAKPAILRIGEWLFVVPPGVTGEIDVVHEVRGVVLQTRRTDAATSAGHLAELVLGAAKRFGPDADMAVQSALFGLAAVR